MPSIAHGLMPKIIASVRITMKMLLIVGNTFSLKVLSLRWKWPFLVLHVPSMAYCAIALHSFMFPLGSLLLISLFMLLSILLFPFLFLMLMFSFVVIGISNCPYRVVNLPSFSFLELRSSLKPKPTLMRGVLFITSISFKAFLIFSWFWH